ncbi:MAG: DUF2652 domain-containing protein [Candidatus Limnocylindria bacterium]
MATRDGPLVIADISGYTAFIADTELDHSREILSELLEAIIGAFDNRLTVAQIEGDAVCFVGDRADGDLVDWIEDAFVRFHRRLRDIETVSTCPCRACTTAGGLTLKFVAHRGPYSWHRVGKVDQLVGTPVNLVHRLLKNHVPSHEYIFATDALMERWPEPLRAQFERHSEEYDHLGRVEGGYHDLAPLRERARTAQRTTVSRDESRLTLDSTIQLPIAVAWHALADPDLRRQWMGVRNVELKPGARGTLLGGEFHCHHGKDAKTVFRVVGSEEPHEMTIEFFLLAPVFQTTRLTEDGPERTRLEMRMIWDRPPGAVGRLKDAALLPVMLRSLMKGYPRKIEALMRARATAPA